MADPTHHLGTVVRNPAEPSLAPTPPADEVRAFHESLPGYAPSPLLELPDLAAELGLGRVLIKDESHRLGLPAFKILGASWAVATTLWSRFGPSAPTPQPPTPATPSAPTPQPPTLTSLREALAHQSSTITLTTATDGNHGRAVARMAKLLGINARIFVPDDLAPDRMDAITSEGAHLIPIPDDYDAAVRHAASWAEANQDHPDHRAVLIQDTAWPGYEDVPAQIVRGYSTILQELDEQLAALTLPDLVLTQAGVGSFPSAVVAHYGAGPGRPRHATVEPGTAACVAVSLHAGRPTTVPGPHTSIMSGLNCGTVSSLAWPVLRAGVSAAVLVDDDAARAGMRTLAGAGLRGGECSGAAVAGLRNLLADPGIRDDLNLTDQSIVILFATEGITDPSGYEEILATSP